MPQPPVHLEAEGAVILALWDLFSPSLKCLQKIQLCAQNLQITWQTSQATLIESPCMTFSVCCFVSQWEEQAVCIPNLKIEYRKVNYRMKSSPQAQRGTSKAGTHDNEPSQNEHLMHLYKKKTHNTSGRFTWATVNQFENYQFQSRIHYQCSYPSSPHPTINWILLLGKLCFWKLLPLANRHFRKQELQYLEALDQLQISLANQCPVVGYSGSACSCDQIRTVSGIYL